MKFLNNKKAMIGLFIGLIVVGFLPMIIMNIIYSSKEVVFGTSGIYQEEEVKEASAEIVDHFTAKSYQEIIDNYFIAEAKEEVTVAKLEEAVAAVSEDWGAYKEITKISLTELKQSGEYYAVAIVEAVYENVNVRFNLILDEELKMAGLSIKNSDEAEE